EGVAAERAGAVRVRGEDLRRGLHLQHGERRDRLAADLRGRHVAELPLRGCRERTSDGRVGADDLQSHQCRNVAGTGHAQWRRGHGERLLAAAWTGYKFERTPTTRMTRIVADQTTVLS